MVSERAADVLARARIAPDVLGLVPGYHVLLLVAEGLTPGPSDAVSDRMLGDAEETARILLGDNAPEALPHVEEWRAAYRAFGAKPQRTRPSVDALLRRVAGGLPRINRLTDAYNAVSISHVLPIGGEDLGAYAGAPALVRAHGDEPFDTVAAGEAVVDHPAPGEVVWRDDAGVTCRRWNWRQCYRTRLTEDTRDAVFICDVLDIEPGDAPARADEVLAQLTAAIAQVSPDAQLISRVL